MKHSSDELIIENDMYATLCAIIAIHKELVILKKGYIALLLICTLVITIVIFYIPISFNGKKVTDVVSTISSIIAPIIGVLSGYAILDSTLKKDKEEELTYNQNMLESLLIYTVMETELLVRNIISIASPSSNDMDRTVILPKELIYVDQGFILVGYGLNRRDFGYSSKQESVQKLLEDSQLINLIYSDSWDTYLRAINKPEDRLNITKWIQVLRSSSLKSYDVVVYRDKVIDIIRRADWIETDINNIRSTQDLMSSYLEDCKAYGLEYDMVVRYE